MEIRRATVLDKAAWVHNMLDRLQPLSRIDQETFTSDLYPAAAESYLRRALEALLDLGRHICAKGFNRGCQEYKEISYCLHEHGVLDRELAKKMRILAGYRNRMVHFYFEITPEELYAILQNDLQDIKEVLEGLLAWLQEQGILEDPKHVK